MKINAFYIIKDSFFETIKDPYLKTNKHGNRPVFYCVKDSDIGADIFWMIPLSSRINKYKTLIDKRSKSHKRIDGLYICKLPSDKESVFLIQDIFPVTINYIERKYTLGGNHLVLFNKKDIKEIRTRSKRVIHLVKNGIRLTPTSPDINKILQYLKKQQKDN